AHSRKGNPRDTPLRVPVPEGFAVFIRHDQWEESMSGPSALSNAHFILTSICCLPSELYVARDFPASTRTVSLTSWFSQGDSMKYAAASVFLYLPAGARAKLVRGSTSHGK